MAYANYIRKKSLNTIVAICYKGNISRTDKLTLIKKIFLFGGEVNLSYVEGYADAFDWFLKNIYRIESINIYEDGVIRLNIGKTENGIWRCLLLDEAEVDNTKYNQLLFEILKND